MAKCTKKTDVFGRVARRRVEPEFCGGDISSEAGMLLLRQADRRVGLIDAAAGALIDDRVAGRCRHRLVDLLRQRVFAIAQGYEDLNDHDRLRRDLAVQTALSRVCDGASPATLCRFENGWSRESAWAISRLLVEQFIASHETPPEELILDFDATDDPVHGNQDGRFFHGYYDQYCFLPLYVFCGEQLLVSYLRPSRIDAAKHAGAILKLLVERLRQQWPHVRIVFRGDSGFCRRRVLRWCEHHDVDYLVGLARNARLEATAKPWMEQAQQRFVHTGDKQRLFGEFCYAAGTWHDHRRVIAKCEVTAHGPNPRFVVTNSPGHPQLLYDRLYCARGEMENRIKEQQLGLFADRTSAHHWWANQCRLLLSSLAYVLMQTIRRIGLAGTQMGKAQVQTIWLRLLKIGAVVIRNTRRIRLLMPSHHLDQHLWLAAAERLRPSG